MKEFSYKPENGWVGDVIPYYENGKYYAFYLHDPRCKEEGVYAEDTTWHLAVTENGLDFENKGESIERGSENKPYLNNYTGSVIKDRDGLYHAYFTAFNEAYKEDGRAVQSVMEAVGEDLLHLEIKEESRFTADNEIYEMFDWRDPYVFYNEEKKEYWMLLCARRKGTGYHRGGCIALCTSKDLKEWKYEAPFYEPDMYITMECPEVFKMGRWYYLVFSTFSDRFLTHYRKAESLDGPWLIPVEDSLDARCCYAIKTAGDDTRRFAFGWIPTRRGCTDYGPWEWGGTMMVHQLKQENDGDLSILPLKALDDLYCVKEYEGKDICLSSDGLSSFLLPSSDCFSMDVDLESDASEFGFFLDTDETLENGYQLKIRNSTVSWDIWPRKAGNGCYQWQIDGDKAFLVETIRYLKPAHNNYRIRVFRSSETVVVYINDTALSMRFYRKSGGKMGIYSVGGDTRIKNLTVKSQKQ